EVTAVDVNPEAVRCTIANAAQNRLRLVVRESDLFSALTSTTDCRPFDVIAWNPPFLPGVPKSPAECAFYGGPNFDVIRRFAATARGCLKADGTIYTILSADIDIA